MLALDPVFINPWLDLAAKLIGIPLGLFWLAYLTREIRTMRKAETEEVAKASDVREHKDTTDRQHRELSSKIDEVWKALNDQNAATSKSLVTLTGEINDALGQLKILANQRPTYRKPNA